MVSVPTARLVSSLLLGATVGTAVSPWITSRIVALTDNLVVLRVGSASYLVMIVLIIIASRYYRSSADVANS